MTRSNLLYVTGLMAAGLLLSACAEPTAPEVDSLEIPGPSLALVLNNANDADAYCTDLLAGQSTDAGNVCITVEGSALQVTYATTGGWELSQAHLFVGTSQAAMPQTRTGNPKIGNFPYNSGGITGATTHTFSVDLTQWGFDPNLTVCDVTSLFVAAHAAVRIPNGDGTYRTETGWGNGTPLVDRGSWATGFSVDITCAGDETEAEEGTTETAFAYSGDYGTCFIGADFDGNGSDDGLNRWGWSNGALGEGRYTFSLYAGAGRCDLRKGTLVGTVTVEYAGGTATVTYAVTNPYYLVETHLFVGSEPLARDVNGEYTVAPGQYPNTREELKTTTDRYTVTGLSGGIYVVAHATVGGF